jgi:ectoine hydroxylase-related dioxygenase (phytanoyl-CoA dioxygenase family)
MWHHDEKNNGYYSKGVICIIYLSDVLTIEDGPFEFISASHHFSQNLKDHDYFEKNLQNKYANKIISVLGRAGTIIFADSRIIHRARPHNKKCCRESLFIQVSKKTKNIYKERILVNPYFLLNQHLKNKELMTYLGFGLRSESHIFPPTSIDTLPLNYETLSIFVKWVLNKTLKKLFEILPVTIKKMVRKNFGKEIDYDSIK